MFIFVLKRFISLTFFAAIVFMLGGSPLLAQNRFPSAPKTVDVKGKPLPINGGTPTAYTVCMPDPVGTCMAKVKIMPTGAVILVMPKSLSPLSVNAFIITAGQAGTLLSFNFPAQTLQPGNYNSTLGGYPLQFTLF